LLPLLPRLAGLRLALAEVALRDGVLPAVRLVDLLPALVERLLLHLGLTLPEFALLDESLGLHEPANGSARAAQAGGKRGGVAGDDGESYFDHVDQP
jgi:hypothetical protein